MRKNKVVAVLIFLYTSAGITGKIVVRKEDSE
jgi:hypothetical protein